MTVIRVFWFYRIFWDDTAMAFSILATIIRLHIMNYVDLSAIINAYKLKRKRYKKHPKPKQPLKKTAPPAFQIKLAM